MPLRRLGRGGGRARELLDKALGDRRGEQRLALRDDADACGELLGRHVLEQEAARAGSQRLVDVLVEVERREHQHPHGRVAAELGHPPRRLDPVELRHADVHQDDVRLELAGELHRLGAVGRLADHVEVVLGVEDHPEAGADEGLVVGDEDARHALTLSRSSSGRRARTRNPPFGRGPASSSPP
jgi:hypothetical protein